jgi:hypothetical protein
MIVNVISAEVALISINTMYGMGPGIGSVQKRTGFIFGCVLSVTGNCTTRGQTIDSL